MAHTSIYTLLIAIATSLVAIAGTASSPLSLPEIRTAFYESVESSTKTNTLYKNLKNHPDIDNPLIKGYLGATESLLAKHAWNPYNKLNYLNQSQETLSQAIKQAPEQIEVRFLRFSIQHYLPTFLGASKNLKEDRASILQQLQNNNTQQTDQKVLKGIVQFMIDSKRCTEEENRFLQRYIKDNF